MIEDKEKIVRRIQALLAKAEATTFEEEANTFIAKAQELMIKYAVDEAEFVAKGEVKREEIITRTISINHRKSSRVAALRSFLNIVAGCFNCKMWYKDIKGISENNYIAGFESDVIFVEMMFYSIQMQLHGAVLRGLKEAKEEYAAMGIKLGQTVWIRNFTEGYLYRVGARMEERYRKVEETFGTGAALALRDKGDLVSQWADQNLNLQPAKRPKSKKYDPYAYRSGSAAGDKADIGGGRIESKKKGELT